MVPARTALTMKWKLSICRMSVTMFQPGGGVTVASGRVTCRNIGLADHHQPAGRSRSTSTGMP